MDESWKTADSLAVPRFGPADVERRDDECLYQGFFRMERRHLRHRLFNGGWSDEVVREVHIRHDAVGVLLYDVERDAVVLVEQIRAGALDDPESPWKLEVVAGLIENGDDPADVARREAMEEAGCDVGELYELYTYYPSPGACNERVRLYCGLVDTLGVGGVHGLDEENEDIQVHIVPYPQLTRLVEAGRLDNAMTLIAYQWLARERASLRAAR